jgi:L-cysteine desulfidase
MASKQRVFQPGEGLVEENVEDTIANVGRMGREGMRSTDVEILNMMLGN